ncbi:MAG: phosphoserine phosphatase SerB [Helicobacter sp.]|nr:phosphoserine phosphatase SerB [Helicobacter sp.]
MTRLAVFDFDSTLMDGETIDFLARECGVGDEVAQITDRAMRGELDFFESLQHRVSLLSGLPLARAQHVCAHLPLMNGAADVIAWLKANGYVVVVFSGGFHLATSVAQTKLGFDAAFANTLHHKDGVLSGKVGGEMMFSHSKGDMLLRLQALLGVGEDSTLVVGDGANDLSMFAHATHRVAFCAKPVLKEKATICVDSKDLRLLIPHLQT